MRRLPAVWYWVLAVPFVVVASLAIDWVVLVALDMTLSSTPLNIWGDMEGLIIPAVALFAILCAAGLVGAWALRRRSARYSAHAPT